MATKSPELQNQELQIDIEWLSKQTPAEIIAFKEVIANRDAMTDVNSEFEIERQRRLFSMIKHSTKFKKSLVEQANAQEAAADAFLIFKGLDEALAIKNDGTMKLDELKKKSGNRVCFAE
ncbi:hypothetical protein HK098_004510 [Nowakowskiella sp. JEL0407]|nr:hypothetical protein HK098_004510 [Nowakowskiella sp. JEL0407]